jgi:DNA modification methylase
MSKVSLINGDCLVELKNLSDNSVDLVLIDPPYNIGKDIWDKWKTVDLYVEFLKNVFIELQRVLKDNGSFYFFHNDFMQIVEIQNMINKDTDLIFKQLITWSKIKEDFKNIGYVKQRLSVGSRNYYNGFTEYCLFYTFQDETGRKKIDHDITNYKTLREYSKSLQNYIGLNKKNIVLKIGQKVDHFFRHSSSQFSLPTENTYKELTNEFNLKKFSGYKEYEELRQEYEELRQEYEELRQEYEEQRYIFNNTIVNKDLRSNSNVWLYQVAKKEGHITTKPIDLLQNIIKHSSNEGDTVLDCFMGSGSTGVAAKNLNRDFIGIELDEDYFKIATKRIKGE